MMNYTRPGGMFGLGASPFAPMEDMPAAERAAMPPPAFVNGPGGQRYTPGALADHSAIARQHAAAGMDTSPVGHWTQGAARIAQALVGSMEQRRVDRAEQSNADATSVVAKALMSGGKGMDPADYQATLLGAAGDPYIDPSVRNLAAGERERIIKANAPEYFMSGGDRVRFDPTTGQSSVVYDAPEEFQTYAQSLGYQPGTPEYQTAAQDYVLRGNGPTAYRYDSALEEDRQGNRIQLEGVRQSNRLSLRGTPTYSDLHARPRAAGGGGAPRPLTMAGTVAPILAKVAAGQPLTNAEQQAWSMYRPPNRGRGGSAVAAALAAGSVGGAVRIKSKEDYARLPKGATFIDPSGVQRTKR